MIPGPAMSQATFHEAEPHPLLDRELLGLASLSSQAPCSAVLPPRISQSQGRVPSLFHLAGCWDNNWTGFNWPGNQRPTERSLCESCQTSCSLPVPGWPADGQTALPAFAFVRGSEFAAWNHRMEVMYFRGTVQASTGSLPVLWLLKGLHLLGGGERDQGQQRRLPPWLF